MLTRIGKFEVARKLGEGAMGEVYLARDPLIGREVAIKTIHPNAATAPDARDRFFREAQAAGRLNHPNLVTILEFGEDQGLLFMAMEYVPGEDLTVLLRGGQLGPGEALEVVAQVCEGLGHAHQYGVLHRDVKPSNVRVTRSSGRPLAKVMDFGIARLAGSDMTGTGTLLGTFGYMAPEYIQTGKPDARSDLFAAGVILYEALAGHKPFEGDTTATILYRIIHEDPQALDPARIGGISPAIQALLKRALAKDPVARFQTGEAMAAALRAARNPAWEGPLDPDATVRTGSRALKTELPTAHLSRPRQRRFWGLAAGFLGLAGLALGAWLATGGGPRLQAPMAEPTTEAPPQQTPEAPPQRVPPPEPEPLSRKAEAAPEPRPALPRPEPPAPREEKKVPEPPKIQTLEDAAAALDQDPQGALDFLDRHLAEDPSSEKGHALRIAALYQLGRYDLCLGAFRDAARNGFRMPQLLRFPQFRRMMEQEKADPKLALRLKEIMGAERDRLPRRRLRPPAP
jgi:serine/threonine-protein kinase